jgi:hypothetical protein
MVVPIVKLLYNKILNIKSSKLKYVIFNLHDTNLVSLLKFLGYWDRYGFTKYIKFASSLKIELLKNRKNGEFYVKFIFDDFEFQPSFCERNLCSFDDLRNYVKKTMVT